MRPELLDVIVAYSNPIRWSSRRNVHALFEEEMLDAGVRLTTVECAYGDRPHELGDRTGVTRVGVRCKTLLWNKENLLMIGVHRNPDAKYIGFFDGDIHFRKSGWAAEAVHHLQQYHVIQPWSHCYDLGPNDDHLEPVHHAFLKEWWKGNPMTQGIDAKKSPYRFGHCGFAWCWTRQALDWVGGLLEIGCLGAGDHHMALALIGKASTSLPGFISRGYERHVLAWQERAVHHLNMNFGFMPGSIEHSWHGRKEDRRYVSRWSIIQKHKFDPDNDVKRNSHGVLELVGNKPGLAHDLDMYFRQRNEDGNSV